MKNEKNMDSALDALLRKHPVKASADFTAGTLKRIRELPEISDEFMDEFLARKSVRARPDFTARTLRVARQRDTIVSFLRPALAAAASVALCLTGIHALSGDSAPHQGGVAATDSYVDESEMLTLAMDLDGAAPFLDTHASEVLAAIGGTRE